MELVRDYIIADNRIRVFGPAADIASAGVRSFEVFAAEYDAATKPAVEVFTGYNINKKQMESQTLTKFDFSEGQALCILGNTATHYTFRIENEASEPFYLYYEKATDKAYCNAKANGESNPSFIRFGMWMAIGLAMAKHLTAAIHSSTIIANGGAVMFLGESGTGKSTHTRLWRECVEGATLLNDDSPFLKIVDGKAVVYGSPWSGKTPCYKNESYPLRAIVRLSQAPHNAIHRLKGVRAIGALLPSMPPAFAFDKELECRMIDILSATISAVPVYHLECLPDTDAAKLAYNTIFAV